MNAIRQLSICLIVCLIVTACCSVENVPEQEPAQDTTAFAPEKSPQQAQETTQVIQTTEEIVEVPPPLPYPDTPPFGPEILSIDFLEELPPGGHTDYAVVQGHPLVGPAMLRISFAPSAFVRWAENVSVELLSLDRQTTFGTFEMTTIRPNIDYLAEVINPAEPFRIRIMGDSKKLRPFQIYYPIAIDPQPIEVQNESVGEPTRR